MAWARDDAKLERVRALMAERGLDALVVRAPDNVLYLTNFWGMKGYDAVRVPARRRARADLPRGLGGGRGSHGLDVGRAVRARLRRVRPAPRPARARSTPRSQRRATTARVGLELSLGTQASDRMVGEPTTFTKAWFDAWPEAQDATPLLDGRPRDQDRAGDRADPARERDLRSGDGARARRAASRDEGERGRGDLAGLRARRGHGLAAATSSSRSASRSSGRASASRPSPRPATCRSRRTSRRCSRSGSAPTATGATTRSCSARASCAPTTASSRRGCSTSTSARSTTAGRARAWPSSTVSCATGSTRSGYPGQPTHPICHGVGARAHEPPYAHQAGGGEIAEGMVLAIEPGCYWDGGGGLRVEDNFLITSEGAEKLSPFPDGVVQCLT